MAPDWRFRLTGAAAVLVLVQVLALDRGFVLPVLVLVLDQRFVRAGAGAGVRVGGMGRAARVLVLAFCVGVLVQALVLVPGMA